ncbi:DUF4025 domain-containing protein [Ornithinibacillus sp. L9]|uniref:DUF4025 domain-containing protein n=1 Tax=Ornithinibacillus caprae TaxID=2678566 RepID=A0A6N8FJJ5_9BACI|nr:YozQ family protein [Ornithinibacillus caprae]MUK88137.1 DUF4025 domain-containing protein [Ornithinibacillus caprae]
MTNKNKRETINSAKKVAGKMYDVSDYKSNEEIDQGMAVTHEQATDAYTEGTVDGKIDQVSDQNKLENHNGEEIPRKGYK